MKKFNINKTIYIHILPKGWERLYREYGRKYVDACVKPNMVIINDKEYYAMQCWDVFHKLPIFMGCDMPFETDILFKDNDLENVDIDK